MKSKKKLPISVPGSVIKSATEESNKDITSQVAEAAYYKAMNRGFESGHEMEDWLAAESELSK
jgi:hypothetical protein